MDDALRQRLEALNREALPSSSFASTLPRPGVGDLASTKPDAAGRQRPSGASRSHAAKGSPSRAWRGGAVKTLPGLVRRGDAVTNEAGEHWRVVVEVDELWPGGEELVRRRAAARRAKPASGDEADWADSLPDGAVFLDLETCGFAGSAVFLAGVLRPVDGRLAVELLLARDYSEESSMLVSLWQRLAWVATVITFNGKSFDWPMVMDRTRRHLLSAGRESAPARHIDLLHLSRRRWRSQLPDCKLLTLERHICGRTRTDDLPSSQIPAAYQQFVRTRFERDMDAILSHNAIDLVTMLDLAMRLG